MASDPATVADLAAAYRRGESFPDRLQPEAGLRRKHARSTPRVRSRLLNMRYLAPARYRELCADGVLPLSEPDRLLLAGSASRGSGLPRPDR